MPELRRPRSFAGSMADYRPPVAGDGDKRGGHHKGDGRQPERGPVLRARRNGLPVTRAYEYGKASYPWAVRAPEAAEAEHGTPPATRGPRPRKDRGAR